MRCPKYWSFSFSIIPSEEIPGLISFRMDWLDLLAVQGTLKSLPYTCTNQFSTEHSREPLCRSPEYLPFLPSALPVLSCPLPFSPLLLSPFVLCSSLSPIPCPTDSICFGLSEHPFHLLQCSHITRCWVSVLQLTLAIKLQPS